MPYVEGEIPTVVNGNNGYGYNNGGFGGFGWGGDSWLAVIALLAIFGGGFGNGFGWGGNGNNALSSDSAFISRALESGFNSLERKGDYIQEQVCNQTDTMLTGFGNLNTNIMQTGYSIQNTLNQNNVDQLQRSFASQTAMANGFTDIASAQAQARYDAAINNCNLQHAMCENTRDIIDTNRSGTSAVLQKLDQIEYNNLARENAELRTKLSDARFDASQIRQTGEIINTLQPVSKPAYLTASPYQSIYPYGYGYGYGFGNGYGYPFGFGNGGTTIQ